ncbi:TPA: hypothetical protein MW252_003002 [Acinetobacter nosocomialis]|nr:hypothetical protein [Acinetobacter nosocomialis]
MKKNLVLHPSLNSHKGIPVRIFFELNSGAKLLIDPLKYGAGGIVLNSTNASKILLNEPLSDCKISLISNFGKVIKTYSLEQEEFIHKIEFFIIYPDGSTWQGKILEKNAWNISFLVWSWKLARKLNLNGNVNEIFGMSLNWPEVPTAIAFYDFCNYESVSRRLDNHHISVLFNNLSIIY